MAKASPKGLHYLRTLATQCSLSRKRVKKIDEKKENII